MPDGTINLISTQARPALSPGNNVLMQEPFVTVTRPMRPAGEGFKTINDCSRAGRRLASMLSGHSGSRPFRSDSTGPPPPKKIFIMDKQPAGQCELSSNSNFARGRPQKAAGSTALWDAPTTYACITAFRRCQNT